MKKEACDLLKLPEPILDNILERLSPTELCSMSEVCFCLIRRCRSNRLWDKHIQFKWGRLLGDVAYREWQFHTIRIMMNNEESPSLLQMKPNGLLGSFIGDWPCLCLSSYLENPRDSANLTTIKLFQHGFVYFTSCWSVLVPCPSVSDGTGKSFLLLSS